MANFVCKLGTAAGQVVSQTCEASSEGELRARLASQGFYVFSVRPKDILRIRLGGARRGKMRTDDMLILNQQFIALSKSGLPLQKSLDLLARQAANDDIREAVETIRDKVRAGALLSEAFEATGKFPKVYCATLRAGERSGSLDRVLAQYIAYQKTARSFRKKFIGALIYPAFLMIFLCALIVLVDTFVIPKFTEFYSELQVPLPVLTVILISVGTGLRRGALFILAGIIFLIVAVRNLRKSGRVSLAWERFKFGLPFAGKLLMKFSVSEFSRTMGTLLQAGTPVVAALETAGASVSSPLLAKAIARARAEVTAGRGLSASLRATGLFPEMALDMIEVGESTGALPAMLESVADFYEEDVNIDLSALVALIDPIMIAFIAVAVGFVLVGFYLPLFSLAGKVGMH